MRLTQLSTALGIGMAALTWQSTAMAISTAPQFSVNGLFHEVNTDSGVEYRTHDGGLPFRSVLEWDNNGQNDGGKASLFRFDGFNIPGLNGKTIGEYCEIPFALGKLLFDNQTGQGSPGVLDTLLSISVTFDDLPNALNWDYKLSLSEYEGRSGKYGDLLNLSGEIFSYKFETEAGRFRFGLLGWSQDEGQTYIDHLRVGDYDLDKLKLFGVINPYGGPDCNTTVVPIPAAVWLFGSGLLALLGLARKHS